MFIKFLVISLFFISFGTHAGNISIFHTNDLHSFFKGTFVKGDKSSVSIRGGYAKLSHLLKTKRKERLEDNVFVLTTDSGDFYSGTLFHSIAMRADIPLFPEYAFFDLHQYDAITLGNHEFDGKDEGFNLLMRKVEVLGNSVPIVSTNFMSKGSSQEIVLKSLLKKVTNKAGKSISFGILGALGPDGCHVSQANRINHKFIGYKDDKRQEDWTRLVDLLSLKANELKNKGADIIILLLHGGGEEDEYLAKKVKNLDIILAGHTHEKYFKKVNGVIISQAGSYGAYLGELSFKYEKGSIDTDSAQGKHFEVTENTPANEVYHNLIQTYELHLKRVLEGLGVSTVNPTSISFDRDYVKHSDRREKNELGTLVSDTILKELKKKDEKIDFYFTANGLIRTSLYGGVGYSMRDLFNVLPIGFHDGFNLGHEVYTFYLTRKEVTNMIDFLDLYGIFKSKSIPALSSSLVFQKRSWGIPFVNRIYDLKISGRPAPGLIKVATNSFLFSYLDLISKKTFGLIDLKPKGPDGQKLDQPFELGVEVEHFLRGMNTRTGTRPQ